MNRILFFILILISCVSLFWKFQIVLTSDYSELESDAKLDKIFSTAIVNTALELTRVNLVAGGSYRAALIAVPGCKSGATIVPINRTGEFQGLEMLLNGNTVFVVDGQVHQEFPTIAFVLADAMSRMGIHGGHTPPFALITRTACKHSAFLAAVRNRKEQSGEPQSSRRPS